MGELLPKLKQRLKVVSNVFDDDLKLIIDSGIEYFKNINDDFSPGDKHSDTVLLFEYCRYYFNDVGELFSTNYAKELLQLSLRGVIDETKVGDSSSE
ncbi:hypothetical protein [Culicoidibacter larvae]|uniref:Phage gp6-like head-tail connector protein n=1 Tax=Culicoidibacter larvae TaxID=2579976 RepID=A0A5R8Q9F5_9FIRM|nr:hypothetical protein [Culicoidibacter larvae]TLG72053.1 hypothetical protein FEZ08_09475 [Culicoidibacter larvae]